VGLAVLDGRLWWYVSRSTGIVAWLLCVASVLWGLALSTRALGRRPGAPWLLDVHRFLGGLSVVFVGFHLLSLALDGYTHWGWQELLVPFASSWKPGPTAWGIVSIYLLVAVEVTSLVMSRLPRRLWRVVHAASFVLFVTASVHLLEAGTDRENELLRWIVVVAFAAVLFLSLYRVLSATLGPKPPRADREAMLAAARASSSR